MTHTQHESQISMKSQGNYELRIMNYELKFTPIEKTAQKGYLVSL